MAAVGRTWRYAIDPAINAKPSMPSRVPAAIMMGGLKQVGAARQNGLEPQQASETGAKLRCLCADELLQCRGQ